MIEKDSKTAFKPSDTEIKASQIGKKKKALAETPFRCFIPCSKYLAFHFLTSLAHSRWCLIDVLVSAQGSIANVKYPNENQL